MLLTNISQILLQIFAPIIIFTTLLINNSSLFHSRLLHKSSPQSSSLLATTPRTINRTISSAQLSFSVLFRTFSVCLVLCCRLSWQPISLSAHVNVSYHISQTVKCYTSNTFNSSQILSS